MRNYEGEKGKGGKTQSTVHKKPNKTQYPKTQSREVETKGKAA